ncbi:MAG: PIN domain-containing protein [Anaerolineales bacterium]
METIFVDTSALYALISTEDRNKTGAVATWENLLKRGDMLITNNYVLVECFSLVQSRLGIEFARLLQSNVVPFLQTEWIDEQQHSAIVQLVLSASRRQLSLVDCSAFETMRRLKIETVFTFDDLFREQGFEVIP